MIQKTITYAFAFVFAFSSAVTISQAINQNDSRILKQAEAFHCNPPVEIEAGTVGSIEGYAHGTFGASCIPGVIDDAFDLSFNRVFSDSGTCSNGQPYTREMTTEFDATRVSVTEPVTLSFNISTIEDSGGECTGVGDSIEITIVPAGWGSGDFTITCTPPSNTITVGSSTSFSISTVASGGFSSPITVSHNISPNSGTLPTISYVNNGQVPNATTTANIATTGSTTPANYTISFTANGGSISRNCNVSLTVNALPPTGDILCQDGKDYSDGPCVIDYEGNTNLQWTSANATSCVVNPGGWTGISGSEQNTGVLTTSQNYTLTCSGPGGSNVVVDSVSVVVGDPPPTADIRCNGGNGPCVVNYNESVTISWTSQHTTTCTATSSPAGFNVTGVSNAGVNSGNLTSNPTIFTLNCSGPGGNASDAVTVNVNIPPPTFTVTCAPATVTISQGSSTSYNLNTFGANGFSSQVTWSVSNINPNPGTPPNVSFINNNQVPNATTVAQISTSTSTSVGTFLITFAANGGSVSQNCNVQLVINPVAAPNPPTNVQASNAVCGQIALTWSAPSGGDTPEGYRVYRKVNGTSNWGSPISGNIPFGTNSYVDSTAVVGTFYNYGVRAYIGGSESTTAEASPASITPVACNGNISTSDKDVIAYEGNASMPPLPEECNHNPNNLDVFRLPNNAAFQVGKTVTFRMSICNTGNTELTSTTVNDVMTNVSNPTNFNYSGCTNPSQTVNNPTSITFTTGSLAPGGVCRITYNAVITAPTGPSAVYRFQNRGNMTAQSSLGPLNHSAYTLPYTFTIQSGPPTRTETP